MHRRNITAKVDTALGDTPVVLLNGARQTGKSTLARQIADARDGQYVTLDDATILAAAASDPAGFLSGLADFAVIDEVQRAPQLFPAIKLLVDRNRKPGRLLLTGSANVFMLPNLAESLAGRMEIIPLLPLTQVELLDRPENLVDLLFTSQSFGLRKAVASDPALSNLIVRGGYPEALERATESRREAWFSSYITAILQRDVRDIANIDGLTAMPRLLQLLAARSAGLLSFSDLSRSMGIPQTTLKRYLALFETVFLFNPLPAWSSNLSTRLIKSPKVHLIDTGLAAYLLGHNAKRLAANPVLYGQLLESFVVGELNKLASCADHRVRLYHYRTTTNREVDVVLENQDGRVIGIEIKAAAQADSRDFNGLRALAEDAGDRFAYGIVLYAGEAVVSFGNTLQAAPISLLWRGH